VPNLFRQFVLTGVGGSNNEGYVMAKISEVVLHLGPSLPGSSQQLLQLLPGLAIDFSVSRVSAKPAIHRLLNPTVDVANHRSHTTFLELIS
jgi:hypothetical protein